jgi:hypothetical protein
MPPVNNVGEPGAGEPHARIEVAGAGNGARKQAKATGVAQPTGKPAEERPQVLPPAEATAPVPDPTRCSRRQVAHRDRQSHLLGQRQCRCLSTAGSWS